MEGVSRNKQDGCTHQLLDLIHKDRARVMRGDNSEGADDEKKLELRLGPPGNNEEKNTLSSHPWTSSTHQKQQPGPLVFPSKPCCTKGVEQKMPSSLPCVTNTSHKRSAPAQILGWPPVRSFRKNVADTSCSKQVVESQDENPPIEVNTNKESCHKGMFVKINMDGVPIGRKVDIKAHNSYESLSSAVDELFRGLLAVQRDFLVTGNANKVEDVKIITGLLDGSGEYTLVYEDHEGDRILVGDVPWNMFASAVKRLRVLKSSKLTALGVGKGNTGRRPI